MKNAKVLKCTIIVGEGIIVLVYLLNKNIESLSVKPISLPTVTYLS